MSPPDGDRSEVEEKALGLFKFLRDFSELRTKTIRSLDTYEDVLWISDIPRVSGCHAAAWFRGQDDDESQLEAWVEIRKPQMPRFPEPHIELQKWLDLEQLHDSSTEEPTLREWIFVEREDVDIDAKEEESFDPVEQAKVEKVLLDESPEIHDSLKSYLKNEWQPWAERDRELRPVQNAYSHLFHLQKTQQRLGEQYEVVLGIGLLKWRLKSGHEVKRHVIAAQTSIELEAASGTIRIGPAGDGAKLILEQDMLDPAERPDVLVQRHLQEHLNELADNVWDKIIIDNVLKSWVNDIASEGKYLDSLAEQKVDSDRPTVCYSPAILFRKRSERSYIRAFDEIIDRIKSKKEIPEGVRRFVSIVSDPYGSDSLDDRPPDGSSNAPDPELYFPLEANIEQRNIINTLNRSQGVLVQGPPGTGKSHTIVNLVAHLLATGNRVLVTSHTARALSVLRRFFEERLKELAPLAVVVLGDDRKGLRAMEESVIGITNKHNGWDKSINVREIEDIEKKLADSRTTRQKVNEDLQAIREQETFEHPPKFGGYQGTLQTIATCLKAEEENFRYFKDTPNEEDDLQVTAEELVILLDLLRDPSVENIDSAEWHVVDPSELQSVEKLQSTFNREAELQAKLKGFVSVQEHPNYEVFGKCNPELIEPVEVKLKKLISVVDEIEKHIAPWTNNMLLEVLADQDRPWWELLRSTESDLDSIENIEDWNEERTVSGIGDRNFLTLRVDASELLEHLESGGKWGFGPFRSDIIKRCFYMKKDVRFDGHPCGSEAILKAFVGWLDIQILFSRLEKRWAPYANFGDLEATMGVAKYRDLCEPIEVAKSAFELVRALQAVCAEIPGFVAPIWHEIPKLRELYLVIEVLELAWKLSTIQKHLTQLADQWLRKMRLDNLDPTIGLLVEAIENRDIQAYTKAYNEISNNCRQGGRAQRRYALLASLKATAPIFAEELCADYRDRAWDHRITVFPMAWDWARAKTWVSRLCDPKQEQSLRAEAAMLGNEIRKHLAALAAKKAWSHCLESLTENERQHLIAWSLSMKRLGKGTGKHASIHRKAARGHMEQCRTAIPAWIMPMYRVAETMRPGVDMFDVAIIDEASQSGPEALLLTYLAKRLVVVGDSKQIIPDFVGISGNDVNELRKLHLKDIPHSDALGADGSFYDLAEIRYQGRVVLREHFRCMPEIIQFSNNLSYSANPLIPLRQYANDRLKPVVEAVHVQGGYREGSGSNAINKPEASAIVERIQSMIRDERYKEKSIGVITLLGNSQSRLIEQKLLEQVGPETMEEHSIICGNAYAFQGDERDVILISMVSAVTEGYRIGVRTKAADERRFNVAASRARDQMILFHSVTLNDLSSHCLQARLLAYCMAPAIDPLDCADISLDELKDLSGTVNRREVKPPEPFDSWFEVDVYVRITERGYRVIPQVRINRYRIDLIIDGMQGRLAVECDGDYWHGPEQYQLDAGRQRALERCGWHFWRVRGSTFYLDPAAALEGLWEELERRGITIGAEPSELSIGSNSSDEASARGDDRRLIGASISRRSDKDQSAPIQVSSNKEEDTSSQSKDLGSPFIIPVKDLEDSNKEKLNERSSGDEVEADNELLSYSPGENDQVELDIMVPGQLPDPRSVSKTKVTPHLVKIVEDNGPVIIQQACQLYVKGAGFLRMGKDLRSALNKVMAAAIRAGTIEEEQEPGSKFFKDRVVRKKDVPRVVIRQRGARDFGNIPVLEIVAVMKQVRVKSPGDSGEILYRKVLVFYDTTRLTQKITDRLKLAEQSLMD
ncbi:MAG: AAA domain-containing protein [Anaerolineae bacterium]|nr:AAA domain-containing protein [Anaerolineae bacterium]